MADDIIEVLESLHLLADPALRQVLLQEAARDLEDLTNEDRSRVYGYLEAARVRHQKALTSTPA